MRGRMVDSEGIARFKVKTWTRRVEAEIDAKRLTATQPEVLEFFELLTKFDEVVQASKKDTQDLNKLFKANPRAARKPTGREGQALLEPFKERKKVLKKEYHELLSNLRGSVERLGIPFRLSRYDYDKYFEGFK